MSSQIKIINENTKPLKVVITPEINIFIEAVSKLAGETITGIVDEIIGSRIGHAHEERLILDIPAEAILIFMLNFSAPLGVYTFSIKGETNVFTPGSECHNLSIEKNYEITFLNDLIGTSCVVKEI